MTIDRLDGALSSLAIKAPCRAGTTAAITLSGLQTIDGVALAADDRVLVKDQTDGTENGIYIADTSGWERAVDFDGNQDVRQGTIVFIAQGAINGTSVFRITTANPITIDSTSIAFASMGLLSTPVPISSGGSGAGSAISALSNFGVIQVTAEAGTNTITGTIDALVTAYRADQLFILVPANDNTGAATFNPTPSGGAALGAKNIFFNGAALTGAELQAGVPVLLQYDGTQFNIIGNSPLVATDPLPRSTANSPMRSRQTHSPSP
jgi:phage-related tail fiber protein